MTAIALTIAGSDSSGGAGIQADLKTFSALGVYGASAITALTAQNTQGVSHVFFIPPAMVAAQIRSVLEDLDVKAIKIGMLADAEIAKSVLNALAGYKIPIVLDPVMVAQSGDILLAEDAIGFIRDAFIPRAILVTPNLPEAAKLLDTKVAQNEDEMIGQAEALLKFGSCAVLLKGGHAQGPQSVDIFVTKGRIHHFSSPRSPTTNTHGTGCSLSSAIAAYLAQGFELEDAINSAKIWLSFAIAQADSLRIGKGAGPVHHFHALWPKL